MRSGDQGLISLTCKPRLPGFRDLRTSSSLHIPTGVLCAAVCCVLCAVTSFAVLTTDCPCPKGIFLPPH